MIRLGYYFFGQLREANYYLTQRPIYNSQRLLVIVPADESNDGSPITDFV